MVSEPALASVDSDTNGAGTDPNKKNQGKVPKKIHKAEREKLKRDQLNELFLELGHALDPAPQNNGKASILGDATRILRDLILQVESLRKENVALLTESRYVMVEKNELEDEKATLEAEIAKLQNELQERQQSNALLHNSGTDPALVPVQRTSTGLPPIAPLYVVPLHQNIQTLSDAERDPSPSKPPTQVMRPHARYPTQADSWPLQILSRNQHSGSSNSANESMERA